ncbi:GxxExxY protein [Flavobacterium psychraquaticum]|uniref:GxxExxY protein n=1 Tax=Flavobacterium psychraquaticum TaxID=3103958 RepID=UPI002ACDCCD8|nr:GxxExxY protein [Flavobacterium sp. LB-N7T]
MKNFPHQELTKAIIGIYYNVYNELGYGFLERVYQNAMLIELKSRGYEIEAHKKINVYYKNEIVGDYIPDIVVNNSLILELKCTECLVDAHEAQLLNYLKATDCEVGLILNFGKEPQFLRKIFTNDLKKRK